MKQEIKSFSKSDEGCNGASVWKYVLEGEDVYLFTPGDCANDSYVKLYDSDCNLDCYWKIGEFDTNCSMSPEYLTLHDEGELVWENK